MSRYLIGAKAPKVNIPINDPERSVSSIHAELLITGNEYYLTDCNSTNGTYLKKSGKWIRIQQSYVLPEQPIMLGRYQTTPKKLLENKNINMQNVDIKDVKIANIEAEEALNGPVERDPSTGEIIRKFI